MKRFLSVAAAVLITAGFGVAMAAQSNTSTPAPGGHCGGTASFRWPVKTAADADVGQVNTTPQIEPVLYLKKVTPPTGAALSSTDATNHRLNSFELSTWQTTATVTTLHFNLHDSDLDISLVD